MPAFIQTKLHVFFYLLRWSHTHTLSLEQQERWPLSDEGPFPGDHLTVATGSILHCKILFSLGDISLMRFLGIGAGTTVHEDKKIIK